MATGLDADPFGCIRNRLRNHGLASGCHGRFHQPVHRLAHQLGDLADGHVSEGLAGTD